MYIEPRLSKVVAIFVILVATLTIKRKENMAETKANEALTEASTPKYQLIIQPSLSRTRVSVDDYQQGEARIDLPITEALVDGSFVLGIEADNGTTGFSETYFTLSTLNTIKKEIELILDASIVNEKQKQGIRTLIRGAFDKEDLRRFTNFREVVERTRE